MITMEKSMMAILLGLTAVLLSSFHMTDCLPGPSWQSRRLQQEVTEAPPTSDGGGGNTGRTVALVLIFLVLLAVLIVVVVIFFLYIRRGKAIRERERRNAISRKRQRQGFENMNSNGTANNEFPAVKVDKGNVVDTFCVEKGTRPENNNSQASKKYENIDADCESDLPPDGDSERLIRKRPSDSGPDGAENTNAYEENAEGIDNPAFYPAEKWKTDPELEEKRSASLANLRDIPDDETEIKTRPKSGTRRLSRANSKDRIAVDKDDGDGSTRSPRENWEPFDEDKTDNNQNRPNSGKHKDNTHSQKRPLSGKKTNVDGNLEQSPGASLPPIAHSKSTPVKTNTLPPLESGMAKLPPDGTDSIETLALQSLDSAIEFQSNNADPKLTKEKSNEERQKQKKQKKEPGEEGDREERNRRHRRHRHKDGEEGEHRGHHRRHRRHRHKEEDGKELTEEEKEKRRRHRRHRHHKRHHKHHKDNKKDGNGEAQEENALDTQDSTDLVNTQTLVNSMGMEIDEDTSEWESSDSGEDDGDINITKSIDALAGQEDKPVTRLKQSSTKTKSSVTDTLVLETLTDNTTDNPENPKRLLARNNSYTKLDKNEKGDNMRVRRGSTGAMSANSKQVSTSQNSIGMDDYGVYDIDDLGATEEMEV